MKTLTILVVFFLVSFSTVFSQERTREITQQKFKSLNFSDSSSIRTVPANSAVETVNGWYYLGLYGTPDLSRIGSIMGQDTRNYQIFSTYGGTTRIEIDNINNIQSDWAKEIWTTYPIMPDTIAIDVKILSMTSNITVSGMRIPVQDSSWWSSGYGKYLDINNSGWQTLSFDKTYEKTFMSHFGRLYLSFQLQAQDSSYIGADIAVSNLRGIDSLGNVVVYDDFTLTGVRDSEQILSEFVLKQNYPNPFNPSTTIRFTIPKREYVNLKVYNSLGQEVKTLVSEEKDKGSYEVNFNASNIPSGVYFYRLQAGSSVKTKKMILFK